MATLVMLHRAAGPKYRFDWIERRQTLPTLDEGSERQNRLAAIATLQFRRRLERQNLRAVIVVSVALLVLLTLGYYMSIFGFGDWWQKETLHKPVWKRGLMNQTEIHIPAHA